MLNLKISHTKNSSSISLYTAIREVAANDTLLLERTTQQTGYKKTIPQFSKMNENFWRKNTVKLGILSNNSKLEVLYRMNKSMKTL